MTNKNDAASDTQMGTDIITNAYLLGIKDEYEVPDGMPLSVFNNKYSRVTHMVTPANGGKPTPVYQTWSERITDVVEGNFSLDPRLSSLKHRPDFFDQMHDPLGELHAQVEFRETLKLSKQGVMCYAGRHLQHGDRQQQDKLGELFTNCSTAMFSFTSLFLLLRGSGVGRDYSSDISWTDWDYMPECRFVLEGPNQWGQGGHPDYEPWVETLQSARHKYDSESEHVRWFTVEDSAEGWVKAITVLETAAFHKNNKDKLFIFDLTPIRPKGTPIKGQQNRPASGPIPFVQALLQVVSVKNAGMKPWKQAMFVDDALAACVALGGIRRAARLATKYWKDRDILEFVDIKREGFLRSANNSILVDQEFWDLLKDPANRAPWAVHARRVFNASTEAAYHDQTGEPGLINVDKLSWSDEGLDSISSDQYIDDYYSESVLKLHPKTKSMMAYVLDKAKSKRYKVICNPCVTADTWVATSKGLQQVSDLIKSDGWSKSNGDELSVTYVVNGANVKGSPFFATGYKKVWSLNTKEGYTVKLTDNHRVLVETGRRAKFGGGYTVDHQWVEAKDLEEGDKIVIHNHRDVNPALASLDSKFSLAPKDQDQEIEGYTIGLLVGDGCYIEEEGRSDRARITLWDNKKAVLAKIRGYTEDELGLTWVEGSEGRTVGNTSPTLAEVSQYWGISSKATKTLTDEIMRASRSFLQGFVAGLFDTDGSVQGSADRGVSLRFSSVDKSCLDRLQIVLLRFGLRSVQRMSRDAGTRLLPDSDRNPEASYELMLGKDNVAKFFQTFDVRNPTHLEKIASINAQFGERGSYADKFTATFTSLDYAGRETVYDVCVPGPHAFSANGFYAHNCVEIPLAVWGGYCTIGDVCGTYARTKEEFRQACWLMARALVRTNLMRSMYKAEVTRTMRIGVGLIGVYEFAWNHFKLDLYDILLADKPITHHDVVVSIRRDPDVYDRSLEFARFIRSCSDAVSESAMTYTRELGLVEPHTATCMKPSGTVSKVMNSTEAANPPTNNFYLRNNQYLLDDPQYLELKRRGYPWRDISHSYPGHHIIGFPTKQLISDMMGDRVVTSADLTPEVQYAWLRWLENHWIGGTGEGGQVSFTMKYYPDKVSYADFQNLLITQQSTVKCCAWMQIMDMSKFAYQPEEPITAIQYKEYMGGIDSKVQVEQYSEDELYCPGGVCPIEQNQLVYTDGTQVHVS